MSRVGERSKACRYCSAILYVYVPHAPCSDLYYYCWLLLHSLPFTWDGWYDTSVSRFPPFGVRPALSPVLSVGKGLCIIL